jgi:hypothetical protein
MKPATLGLVMLALFLTGRSATAEEEAPTFEAAPRGLDLYGRPGGKLRIGPLTSNGRTGRRYGGVAEFRPEEGEPVTLRVAMRLSRDMRKAVYKLKTAKGGSPRVRIRFRAVMEKESFRAPTEFRRYGLTSQGLGATDLNGWMGEELAVSGWTPDGIAVLWNRASGTGESEFDEMPVALTLPTGRRPGRPCIADLDGDGWRDIAAACESDDLVSIFSNRMPDGPVTLERQPDFGDRTDSSVGGKPVDLIAADFDGDGRLDLAVACAEDESISVLRNRTESAVAFGEARAFPLDREPGRLAAADLDGDGRTDLIVVPKVVGAAQPHQRVLLFLRNVTDEGTGEPSFEEPVTVPLPARTEGIAVTDFNADGRPDLALASDRMLVLENTTPPASGDLEFREHHPASERHPSAFAVADLNRDGRPDLVFVDTGARRIVHVLNRGSPGGGLRFGDAREAEPGEGWMPRDVAAVDVLADGCPDLAVTVYRQGEAGSIEYHFAEWTVKRPSLTVREPGHRAERARTPVFAFRE